MAHPFFAGGSSQVSTEEPAADIPDGPQPDSPGGELAAPGPATPMLALSEPSALPACEVRPAEPPCEEPVGTVPEVSLPSALPAPVVASPAQLCPEAALPTIAKEKRNQVDPAQDTTNKPGRVPTLIVPPNWDVPIHQKMVDIFALSRKTVASQPNPLEDADVVVVDDNGGSDGQQAKCPEELDVENDDGEPPLTLRTDQWKLRPKTSRGRGKGRGRGRGRGKQPADHGEPGIVQSSGEEAEAEMGSVADVKPKRPRAKAAPKSRKEKPAAPKAAPKRRGKKQAEEAAVAAEADTVEDTGDMETKQTAALENHVDEDGVGAACSFLLVFNGHTDVLKQQYGDIVLSFFVLAVQEPIHESEMQEEEPESPSAAEPLRKKAKTGESAKGPSFARRVCPKGIPAKQQWEAIRNVFEKVLRPYLVQLGFDYSSLQVQGGDTYAHTHTHLKLVVNDLPCDFQRLQATDTPKLVFVFSSNLF